MISIKDLEILTADDDLLDMLIYAKCMRSVDPRACGLPFSSYDRSELHRILKKLQQELVKRHKSFKASSDYHNKGSP